MYGVCSCMNCEHDECESCQQTKQKTCTTHTKEKEELGICCQEDQEKAEQATYEHSPLTMSIHELAKANPTKTYRVLEKMKNGVCIIGTMKHDRR